MCVVLEVQIEIVEAFSRFTYFVPIFQLAMVKIDIRYLLRK